MRQLAHVLTDRVQQDREVVDHIVLVQQSPHLVQVLLLGRLQRHQIDIVDDAAVQAAGGVVPERVAAKLVALGQPRRQHLRVGIRVR